MLKSTITVVIAMLIFVFLMFEIAKAGEVWDAFMSQEPAKIQHCFGCQEHRGEVRTPSVSGAYGKHESTGNQEPDPSGKHPDSDIGECHPGPEPDPSGKY